MAISYVGMLNGAATTGGTFNISRPSGSATDDIIFAMIGATSTSTIAAFTWPSGWNELYAESGSADIAVNSRYELRWHVYDSAEGSNYSVTVPTLSTSTGTRVHATMSYRGCDTTTPIVGGTGSTGTRLTAGGTTFSTPTETSSVSDVWAVCAFNAFSVAANWNWTESNTERVDRTNSSNSYRSGLAWSDTNGTVDASGGVSYSGTPSTTTYSRLPWIGLLQPPVPAPAYQSCGILLG